MLYLKRSVRRSALCFVLTIFVVVAFFPLSDRVWAQEIIVFWDGNEEPDLAGYKIYFGQTSGSYDTCIDVGMTLEHEMTALQDTGLYYFAVTAYDSAGNESDFSQEVFIRIDGNRLIRHLFKLMANYPNPLNPMTRIPFSLSKERFVTIEVFDMLGKEVKQLLSEEKGPGEYEVVWDGTDQSGIPVASGVYFYLMIVGNLCQSKKLTLTR